jgi:cell division protease FtsH
LICGNISSGSGAQINCDLDAATSLVLNQELNWGLGRNGLAYAPIGLPDRHKMPPILRNSVNKTLATAQDLALQTLTKNSDLLEFITQALLDERELNKSQIAMLFGNVPPALNSKIEQGMYQKC